LSGDRECAFPILVLDHCYPTEQLQEGPTVFAHSCRLGAEGIVSKRVGGIYRSGPCRVWIKVCNPASLAV
jgi:ATP-dependent DNA ligase